MAKKKPRRERERGTVSVRCPKCNGSTRVLRTYSDPEKIRVTKRERICSRNHRFVTTELPEIS